MQVVLSSNNHPDYLPYWPIVSKAWKHFLGLTPVLVFVAEADEEHIWEEIVQCGDVFVLPRVPTIPSGNQSKIARLYFASLAEEDFLINDIDLLPLQSKYVCDYLLPHFDKDKLLCVGGDVYNSTPDKGKTPMGYLMGNGKLLREIVNPNSLCWEEFVLSFVGSRVWDHKEDPSSTIPVGNADCFSDESLLRMLIHKWGKLDKITHINRGWTNYSDRAICRSNWPDGDTLLSKLKDKQYVECHLPHPYCAETMSIFNCLF